MLRNLSTAQVAARAGVHKDTLLRWLRLGLLPEPTRDRRGWRVFSEGEARTVECFAQSAPTELDLASDQKTALKKLDLIDWDFPKATTNYLTHGMHPYPAKFIPQIPNALIQELSSVGETVADIFCGSGTTLVEALALKRNAVGIDANPLACLITEAKTTKLAPVEQGDLLELVERAEHHGRMLDSNPEPMLFQNEPFRSLAARPTDPTISFWFEDFLIEELAEIFSWCGSLPTRASQIIASAAASSIVVGVSRQDSDTRYVRREKNLRCGEAFRRFAKSLQEGIRVAVEFSDLVEDRFTRRVLTADVLSSPHLGTVDLVVCSPPYPNAYSYHLYHMTRMLWLGMDQPLFKAQEIGSHRKYSKRGAGRATATTFRKEMERVFSWLSGYLKPGGFACFVVGNSTIDGETVDNLALLRQGAQAAGFQEVKVIPRTIDSKKKAFNPVIGKIRTEAIQIFVNENGEL
jgi:DNA modification methylase